jgi:serine protease Do
LLSLALIAAFAGGILYAPQFARNVAYAVSSGQLQAEREELAQMAAKCDTLSPLFRKVSKVVMPAVVEVRVTKRVAVSQMPDFGDMFRDDPFFRRYFGDQNPQQRQRQPLERQMKGLGSGVIVDAANGYIITNNHVVGGADEVQIVTADNRKLEAEWVKTDPATDLAVVKVKGENLTSAPLGDSDSMQVGDLVLAIGSPEGLPQTVTKGIISAKGRNQAGLGGSGNLYQNFLQTDAAINHGNSGGPLVNMKGEVIGINTAIVSRTGVNEGIGLSIPSNMIKQIMDQLIAKGKVVRGYIGVSLQNVDSNLARSFNLSSTEGAMVNGVAKGGPGEKAELANGDFITAVDGKKVTDVAQLRMLIASVAPGKTVKLEIYRNGKKQTLGVKVDEQPKDIAAAFTGSQPHEGVEAGASKFGVKVTALTPALAAQLGYKKDAAGAVISEIDPSSGAADQGLRVGMLITKVGDKAIRTPEDFTLAIAAKDAANGVRLEVTTPDGHSQFVFITPSKPHKPLAPTPAPEEEEE